MNNLNLSSETASGYTAVSDIFIDQYVPSANGDFVKVYLYLLRLLSRSSNNLSISYIADTFNQTENDIMRALRYWDKLGLLSLSYDNNKQLCGITFKAVSADNSPNPDNTNTSVLTNFSEIEDNYSSQRNVAGYSGTSDSSNNVVSINRINSSISFNDIEPSKITSSAEKLNERSEERR